MKYTKEWLEKEVENGRRFNYIGFWGMRIETEQEKSMSNFYISPIKAKLQDVENSEHTFDCSEQLFMYRKASFFKDYDIAELILENGKNPSECKRLGRFVMGYVDSEWDKVRYNYMYEAVYAKFSQNPILKMYLLETGNSIIVETSPFDDVWGIMLSKYLVNGHLDETYAWENVRKWQGQNLLGFVLMEVRDDLKMQDMTS